ncbi:FmdB family zinc ribbon protein [Planctomycetota bacterium]
MPTYEYELLDGGKGCAHCRDGFEKLQKITDPALEECPKCGAKIRRVIFAPQIRKPKSDRELKDLGFKKYVRKDSGVFEDVTSDGSEPPVIDINED